MQYGFETVMVSQALMACIGDAYLYMTPGAGTILQSDKSTRTWSANVVELTSCASSGKSAGGHTPYVQDHYRCPTVNHQGPRRALSTLSDGTL